MSSRYAALLLAALAVLGSSAGISVTAQGVDVCAGELPAVLVANYSGLSCHPIWDAFVLRYSQGKEDNVLRVVLSAAYTTGWVGIGFSSNGMMVGSSAIVGWMGKTGLHHISQFYLGGQTASEIKANEGQLILTNSVPVVLVDQAKIYLAFQLKFSHHISRQNIILAFGNRIPVNNHLTIHEDKISILFDFATGTSSGSAYPYSLKRAHGILGIVAWGVLLPIGSIVARYCRRWDPLWFYLHVSIQFVGFVIALAGVVAGVALYNKLHVNVSAHRGLGIFVFVLAILQIFSFFVKPSVDSKARKFWTLYHHWVGRFALFFAAINIVLGIKVGGAGDSWKVGYGINLAILLLTTIFLEILMWTKWSKKATPPPF